MKTSIFYSLDLRDSAPKKAELKIAHQSRNRARGHVVSPKSCFVFFFMLLTVTLSFADANYFALSSNNTGQYNEPGSEYWNVTAQNIVLSVTDDHGNLAYVNQNVIGVWAGYSTGTGQELGFAPTHVAINSLPQGVSAQIISGPSYASGSPTWVLDFQWVPVVVETNTVYVTNDIVSGYGTNGSSFTVSNAVAVMQAVDSDPSITSAFQQGLYLGCVIVAGLLGFSLLRTIPGSGSEEL